MNPQAVLDALSTGDVFDLIHALDWDECRSFEAIPPESMRDAGIDPLRRVVARRGTWLLDALDSGRDMSCHPELRLHGPAETVEEAEAQFKLAMDNMDRHRGVATALVGADRVNDVIRDSGWVKRGHAPDTLPADWS